MPASAYLQSSDKTFKIVYKAQWMLSNELSDNKYAGLTPVSMRRGDE